MAPIEMTFCGLQQGQFAVSPIPRNIQYYYLRYD